MTFSVNITENAENDMREIYEYIAYKLFAPQSVTSLLEKFEKSINSLDQMPERFHRYPKEPWFSRGVRVMYINNYNVFYAIDKEKKISDNFACYLWRKRY